MPSSSRSPLGLAAGAAPAAAATASLVADLRTTSQGFFDPDPPPLFPLGDKVLWSDFDGIWASDSTSVGTVLLRNTNPESGGGFTSPPLAAAGRIAFFLADEQLWRTDGTPAGTFPVGPAPPEDPGSSLPPETAVIGANLFYRACGDPGCGLWKSDGTPAGTVLVADLSGSNVQQLPQGLTAVGDTLFFVVRPFGGNPTLWRSNSTAAGTVPEREFFFPGPRLLTAAGGRLFFVAETSEAGQELWASDGTEAGTRPLTAFAAPEALNPTSFLEASGESVYFVADEVTGGADLWTSDGTPAGTRRVTDFGFAHPFDFPFGPGQVEKVGGRLLFLANDGLTGLRLWTSDGTPAGTAPLAGCPEGCPAVSEAFHEPTEIFGLGGHALFAGRDPAGGEELWTSDGTGAGTRRLRDICPGPCTSFPTGVTPLPGQAYFFAQPGGGADQALWRTDGTPAGTRRVALVESLAFDGLEEPRPVAAGRKLYFVARGDLRDLQLWVSDGTAEGTEPVSVLVRDTPSSFPGGLVSGDGGVLFSACDGLRRGLWTSDGTAEGTRLLPAPEIDCFSHLRHTVIARLDGITLFFLEVFGRPQLWATDGTPAGTRPLAGSDESFLGQPVLWRGKLLFTLATEEGVLSFWESDGTPAGTRPLFELPGGNRFGVAHLTPLGGRPSPSPRRLARHDRPGPAAAAGPRVAIAIP